MISLLFNNNHSINSLFFLSKKGSLPRSKIWVVETAFGHPFPSLPIQVLTKFHFYSNTCIGLNLSISQLNPMLRPLCYDAAGLGWNLLIATVWISNTLKGNILNSNPEQSLGQDSLHHLPDLTTFKGTTFSRHKVPSISYYIFVFLELVFVGRAVWIVFGERDVRKRNLASETVCLCH